MKRHTLRRRTHRAAIALVISCVALALPGCDKPESVQHLDTYLARLARTLEQEAPNPAAITIARPPDTSDLGLNLPSANLGTLDFLSLTGCAVQITVGKRNSSLGKFASDSQRLLLELEYLEHAPACIDHLRKEGRDEVAETLQQAFMLKREQLPSLIFNATLGSIEFREFWKKPRELADYPRQTSSAVLSALGAITLDAERWLGGDYQADNREFEIQLSEVARGDGGALLLALATQAARLGDADQMLQQSLASGPLCADPYRNPAADILPTVIKKYFIADIQPWSAALSRRYYELIPALTALEDLVREPLPQAYTDWVQGRHQAFSSLISAPRVHVQLLKEVLKPCERD